MIFDTKLEKIIFYNFPVILFSLIPFFLITGPFFSDLSVSLICIIFLFYCLKKKNFSFFKKKYFYFFIVFWIYLILNSLINNFNFDSLKISFFYFRFGVFVIALTVLLKFNDNFIKYFFYSILICFSVLIIDGFFEYFNGSNLLGYDHSATRISSLFGDEFILGSYMIRLWPVFFGLYILISNKNIKKNNYLFLIFISIFILSETLIFLSGDRAAFFYINLSAVFVILFSKSLFKLRLITLLSSLILISIISFHNPTAKERVVDRTIKQMNLGSSGSERKIYIFSENHTELFTSAYKMFLDNKILGVGIKNFRNFCGKEKYYKNDFSCSTHPHNSYLQVLTETGVIGFLFLAVTLLYFLKHLINHIILKFKKIQYFNDFEICILSGLAIYLWPFIPTGNIFNNWLNIMMILNLPFLIWSLERNKK